MNRRPRALSALIGVFFLGVGILVFLAELTGTTVDDQAFAIVGLLAVGVALLVLALRRATTR